MEKPKDLQTVLIQAIERANSLEMVAEAADLLALDARFNLWIATVAKNNKDIAMLDLVDYYQDIVDLCCNAFQKLVDENEVETFRATVASAQLKLKEIMS